MNKTTRNVLILGVAAFFILSCCLIFTLASAAGLYLYSQVESGQIEVLAPSSSGPSFDDGRRPTPQPTRAPVSAPAGAAGISTEDLLAQTVVPQRDLADLAMRLRPGVGEIPRVVNERAPDFQVGDQIDFWVANTDDDNHFRIRAELIHRTDVAYAWVEVDREYDGEAIARSVDNFSRTSYPKVREFFGQEWSPGVDNDPRVHILHAYGIGGRVYGYYSSQDEYSALANEFSNEKEIFYINLEILNRSQEYDTYETVLAHEFQHMVHWATDQNEESWVNEGLSELAQEIAGYPPDTSFAREFADIPDTQLNTWSDNPNGRGEHYGSAYLFMAYFLQRFGRDLTKAVVAEEANGIAGFNAALTAAGYEITFDDIFADWVLANYLDDPEALGLDGVLGYTKIDQEPPILDRTVRKFPQAVPNATVRNYATDYILIKAGDPGILRFEGQTETALADLAPYSGERLMWSNRTDESDARLTRQFDFSAVRAGESLVMDAAMWWHIEEDFDYGYVSVSRDGRTWDILPGQHTTTENPNGANFSHGYTHISTQSPDGTDAEWINEAFDLSAYAGEKVWVRFEYVTDPAVNTPGWFIDDIRIPAIGYATDFEQGLDGWESEGWLWTDNRLAQGWLVQTLTLQDDRPIALQRYTADAAGKLEIDLADLGRGTEVLVTVSALAPVTTEPAWYSYTIEAR